MSLKNAMGDFEITDPQAMRALAHPVRLAALSYLQQHGPTTATRLSPHVGATPSVVSWHLRHLERFGLVRDWDGGTDKRQRWWQAVARGFRFEMPDDAEGEAAGRALSHSMLASFDDLPRRWAVEVEPGLDHAWRSVGGASSTRVAVTPEEARSIQDAIEQVLVPYVQRGREEAPPGSRWTRLLRYSLPEAADPPAPSGPDER